MDSNKITCTTNKVFSYCNLVVGFILLNEVKVAAGSFVDYKENSELIHQLVGHNITLECSLDRLLDNFQVAEIKYNWFFKQCGESSGGVLNCYDTNDNEDWTQIPCENNYCKSELHLRNVTEKYSGLYKCSVMPKIGNILDVKLVRKFQLDIKNSSLSLPEFLDEYPINKSSNTGSQVIFHCRVYSEEYPTIKWFRRLSNSKYNSHESTHTFVYYNDKVYELLTSTREKAISRNVYLSKLIINSVLLEDAGFYACVAISFHGHNIREAHLKVNAPNNSDDLMEYWSDYDEENVELLTNPKELWLLFLMPVGLALFPLTLWLCYAIQKRYSLRHELKHSEESDHQCMLKS